MQLQSIDERVETREECDQIKIGTSLTAQWLRLYPSKAGKLGSIPGQGARSHMPQLKDPATKIKDPGAVPKTRHCERGKKKD